MEKLKELDFELEHVQIITEEKIETKKLPKEIKDKMKVLNMICGTYLKDPKAETREKLQILDTEIADMLADYVEDGMEEHEPEPIIIAAPIEPIVPIVVAPVEPIVPIVVEPITPTPKYSPEVEVMMVKINENMFGGRIKISKLTEIIGQSPIYPIQLVGELKLKKVFLADSYQFA